MRRAILATLIGMAMVGSAVFPGHAAGLSEALEAVRDGAWDDAARDAAQDGPIAEAIVEWHRLRAGQGSFAEYNAFLSARADWPGLDLMRRRGEFAIPPGADPQAVLEFFGPSLPQTGEGMMRLAAALKAVDEPDAAEAAAIRAWTEHSLSDAQESTLLAEYGRVLADHHVARLDMLLWRHRFGEAERMRGRVPEGWRRLMDARIALRRDAPGVDTRIDAVPEDLRDHGGLAFERMEWRARRDRDAGVLELMLAASATAERLGDPEAWAPRRRPLVRALMREGRHREAYLLASQHHLTSGVNFADLEWLAGYIALQKLDEPAAALSHFKRFRANVRSTISLGRAGYWEGRAHEALGQTVQAQAAYAFGAEFQTTFYGQLAAEKAGMAMDPRLTGAEDFAVPGDAAFLASEVYAAGRLLHGAGEPALAARFFAHMAESMSRDEIGQLAAALEDLDDAYVQLRIGKRAARYGETLPRALFPVVPISVDEQDEVSAALALAIARRESEFNPVVVSPAGARGLMQLMPGTAEETAGALGLPYSLARLTSDPEYNARLGTAYLEVLRRRFGDATILVAAGYNAGPSRPARWVREYGDPRNGSVDPVDWIESIPFRETRNYVMRVMESLAPYRARLSGETVAWTLSEELRAR